MQHDRFRMASEAAEVGRVVVVSGKFDNDENLSYKEQYSMFVNLSCGLITMSSGHVGR